MRTYNPANVTTCMLGVAGDSSLVITGDAKGYGTFWDMDFDEKTSMVGVRDWHSMAVTDMSPRGEAPQEAWRSETLHTFSKTPQSILKPNPKGLVTP